MAGSGSGSGCEMRRPGIRLTILALPKPENAQNVLSRLLSRRHSGHEASLLVRPWGEQPASWRPGMLVMCSRTGLHAAAAGSQSACLHTCRPTPAAAAKHQGERSVLAPCPP